jgi:hypothetical protein
MIKTIKYSMLAGSLMIAMSPLSAMQREQHLVPMSSSDLRPCTRGLAIIFSGGLLANAVLNLTGYFNKQTKKDDSSNEQTKKNDSSASTYNFIYPLPREVAIATLALGGIVFCHSIYDLFYSK